MKISPLSWRGFRRGEIMENKNSGLNADNNKWRKDEQANNNARNNADQPGNSQAPNKDRDYKVLNSDGSLPDLPEENVAGKGALDGTVGLGT
jgi:hypothetical protein